MYFKPEHDAAVLQWKHADTREQYQLYDILIRPITYMTRSILKRYFSFNWNEEEEIVSEAIIELFIKLHNFNPERKTKPYSFCQTVIKNYIYTKLVLQPIRVTKVGIDYIDNLETQFQDLYEENIEINYEAIISRFNARIVKLNDYIHSNHDNEVFELNACNKEILYLKTVITYLSLYSDCKMTFDSMQDYLLHNTELSTYSIQSYTKKYFGTFSTYTDSDIGKTVGRKRYADELRDNMGILNDDFTPKEMVSGKDHKRLKYRKTVDKQWIYY
jgi:hypothetical protein